MQSKVQLPAILLMIASGLALLMAVLSLLLNLLGTGAATVLSDMPDLQGLFSGTIGILFAAFHILIQGFIFFGALKMKNLESYGLAMGSAVLAVIPCLNPCPCCVLNFGLGVWALVVLLQADVKAAFAGFQA